MEKNNCYLDPDKLLDKANNFNKKLICSLCKGIIIEPVELFCNHIFCSFCLNEWSEKLNDKCPVCNKLIYKKPILTEENKNLLHNLKFMDKEKIYTYDDYINYIKSASIKNLEAGPNLINNPNDNNNINYKCKVCGKEYNS